LNGYYPQSNKPDPQFYSDFNSVCTSAPVQFHGFSAFSPDAWNWIFSPSSVTFVEGTGPASQNPIVIFEKQGRYDVGLQAGNIAGTISSNQTSFINVGNTLELEIAPVFFPDTCINRFDSLLVMASGAQSYNWQFEDGTDTVFTFTNGRANPVVVKPQENQQITLPATIAISVNGEHGDCSASASYVFPLYGQPNDDVQDALRINMGKNGMYSNQCATVQEGEPEPLHTSCTGQFSWCDEYSTGRDIVENSVWFYFIPETDKILQLRSTGFDNQIAVYKALSAESLLNGDYTLIGANDDYTESDFHPFIELLGVVGGQTYWVQVDGSGGGTEGEFYLYLEDFGTVSSDVGLQNNTEIRVYPQPATDIVHIESSCFAVEKTVFATVYHISGPKIWSGTFHNQGSSVIQLNTSTWKNGVYQVQLISGGKVFSTKILK
jgi:PKD repeat protein